MFQPKWQLMESFFHVGRSFTCSSRGMNQESHVPPPISLHVRKGKSKSRLWKKETGKERKLKKHIHKESWRSIFIQAISFRTRKVSEKFSELFDSTIGTLISNPCNQRKKNPEKFKLDTVKKDDRKWKKNTIYHGWQWRGWNEKMGWLKIQERE